LKPTNLAGTIKLKTNNYLIIFRMLLRTSQLPLSSEVSIMPAPEVNFMR